MKLFVALALIGSVAANDDRDLGKIKLGKICRGSKPCVGVGSKCRGKGNLCIPPYLVCDEDGVIGEADTCQPGGGPGELCYQYEFCEFGLVCNYHGTCCIPPGSDISCYDSSTCCGSYHSGTQCNDNRCMCEFYYVTTHKTWANHDNNPPYVGPNQQCVLASILNQEEQDAAFALAQAEESVTGNLPGQVWLGGQIVDPNNRDRGWEWVDGENFDENFALWASNQPNDSGGAPQNKIAWFANGEWDDGTESAALPALFKCCPD